MIERIKNQRRLLVCMLIALATIVSYAKVPGNGFVLYDDDLYVTNNSHVSAGLTARGAAWALTDVRAANWHPLTWLSHMLDSELFGSNPAGHHLTSLLFHIANSVLLFLVLEAMTASIWRSAFVAFLFAVHPIHVQSVAWVSERKDVLSSFFWILAMGAWVRYCARPGSTRYFAVALLLLLGFMSKAMLVTFPIVLLILDFWPLGRISTLSAGRSGRKTLGRLLWEKTPFFLLACAAAVVAFVVQSRMGCVATGPKFSFGIRLANAAVSYVEYLWKMAWPKGLAVFYPHMGAQISLRQALMSAAVMALVTVLALRLAKRRPWFIAGWLWYLITLLPVIGLVQIGAQAMADRYAYMPSIGIFIIVAWGVPDILIGRLGKKGRAVLAAAAVVVLFAMGGTTWKEVGYWHDSLSLFGRAAAVTRDNYEAHSYLARVYAEAVDLEKTIEQYREAARIRPDDPYVRNNLAAALARHGDGEEAIAELLEAIRIKPGYVEAYNNLGAVLKDRGELGRAIESYEEAIRLRPDFAMAHNNLAVVLFLKGDEDGAARETRLCLKYGGHPDRSLMNLLIPSEWKKGGDY